MLALHALGLARDVEAADARAPAARAQDAAQHADRGRLAGAVRAEKAEDACPARPRRSMWSTATNSPKTRVSASTALDGERRRSRRRPRVPRAARRRGCRRGRRPPATAARSAIRRPRRRPRARCDDGLLGIEPGARQRDVDAVAEEHRAARSPAGGAACAAARARLPRSAGRARRRRAPPSAAPAGRRRSCRPSSRKPTRPQRSASSMYGVESRIVEPSCSRS